MQHLMVEPKGQSIFSHLPSIWSLFSRASRIRNTPVSTQSNACLSPYGSKYLESASSVASLTAQVKRKYERTYPLLDLEALKISPGDYRWFRTVDNSVRDVMKGLKYDVSSNYQHMRCVVKTTKYILQREARRHQWARDINRSLCT
jgi:hypothetical protein